MTKREANIIKANNNGYKIEQVGSMFFVNDVNGDCHGYFEELNKAENKLANIGKNFL